jgi:CysZ protein
MIDAAVKALAQMFSPPFRRVLLKAVGLALLLITVAAIALNRILTWLVVAAQDWAKSNVGFTSYVPVEVLVWVITIAAGLGVIVGSIFLMPAVTGLLAGFFADEIAEEVERRYYPGETPGRAMPMLPALWQGIKTALLAILVYLVALPSLLIAGFGVVIFFLATAFLLSREYFELAAMRYRSPAEARQMRKANQSTVLLAGLLIAAFVSIPILNLATPLFATALMVHLHRRLVGAPAATVIEAPR